MMILFNLVLGHSLPVPGKSHCSQSSLAAGDAWADVTVFSLAVQSRNQSGTM